LSRIIQTESNSTQRKRFLEGMAVALRYAAEGQMEENEQKDILAFFVLSMRSIDELNEKTILAWEKRGYWIKADKFRMQWNWVRNSLQQLERDISNSDFQSSIITASQLAQHLTEIQLSSKKRAMKPWVNAWSEWKRQSGNPK
jgi:hypothetical protein